jgi:hypothetical protein
MIDCYRRLFNFSGERAGALSRKVGRDAKVENLIANQEKALASR